jgi:hypothetical protein
MKLKREQPALAAANIRAGGRGVNHHFTKPGVSMINFKDLYQNQ